MPRATQSCVETRAVCERLSPLGPDNEGMGRPFKGELVTSGDAAANSVLVVVLEEGLEARRGRLATPVRRDWPAASCRPSQHEDTTGDQTMSCSRGHFFIEAGSSCRRQRRLGEALRR